MEYITIYRTLDETEISIITDLFEQEEIEYKILDEGARDSAGLNSEGVRLQVLENQKEKAREILMEGGFLDDQSVHSTKARKSSSFNKWIFIFLAALVVVIVAVLIMWFMNV